MEADMPAHRPNPALLATEPLRAFGELSASLAISPLLARAPRGDGHAVVVLPGLAASDASTLPLRRFLRGLGYHVHGWRLGRNQGPTQRIVSGLETRFSTLRELHESAPISIVGWSLGGIYAREIARRDPDSVRQVITLGSPFRMTGQARSLRVPVTNVYTKGDGIVSWRDCIDSPGPRRENIEVRGSHCGLGVNAAALLVIADRLAQPAGTWEPFVPKRRYSMLFPSQPAAA
jgi:pimeloyl-ACP methyl ester carboxylesterase